MANFYTLKSEVFELSEQLFLIYRKCMLQDGKSASKRSIFKFSNKKLIMIDNLIVC